MTQHSDDAEIAAIRERDEDMGARLDMMPPAVRDRRTLLAKLDAARAEVARLREALGVATAELHSWNVALAAALDGSGTAQLERLASATNREDDIREATRRYPTRADEPSAFGAFADGAAYARTLARALLAGDGGGGG